MKAAAATFYRHGRFFASIPGVLRRRNEDRHMFGHLSLENLQCGLNWALMLKKRGFKYAGSITIYSHLQACGIINDHDRDCPCRQQMT